MCIENFVKNASPISENWYISFKKSMILLMLQRWFTLSNPITHILWGFKFGRGTLCLLQHLSPHLPTAAWHVTPFFMQSHSFFLLHCLHFYRPTSSQAKFLFCFWAGGLARDLPEPPPRQLVWPLIPPRASLLFTSCSHFPSSLPPQAFFSFPQKASVKFKLPFHISEAFLFLNFIVNSCSLHWFFWFSWNHFPFLKHIYRWLDASEFL